MATRDKIVPIYVEDEMRNSYIDYSMSVIVSRALPDVRDGLKPVHRRVLVAMRELNLLHDRPFRKSAKITGDVTGNYHPHGTAAVYETMVRMAQTFSMRYPLVDGQGNFGSVDGDAPAAERYTEARLTEFAEEMLRDIERDTVDMRPNYDESREEPVVLPAAVPNLLVNGSAGIAVGMATNVPPHNLREIVDAIHHVIDNPECDIEALIGIVSGRDLRPARRIRPRRHADRDRAEARRAAPGRPEPALQAHPDADHFRREHAGAGGEPAADAHAEGDDRALHHPPPRGGGPPHQVRP